MMDVVIIGIYVAGVFLFYGFNLAFWDGECPILIDTKYDDHRFVSMLFAVCWPVSFLPFFLFSITICFHGVKWSRRNDRR